MSGTSKRKNEKQAQRFLDADRLRAMRRSDKTRCRYPGCTEMAMLGGIRCPDHFGLPGPRPGPEERQP